MFKRALLCAASGDGGGPMISGPGTLGRFSRERTLLGSAAGPTTSGEAKAEIRERAAFTSGGGAMGVIWGAVSFALCTIAASGGAGLVVFATMLGSGTSTAILSGSGVMMVW